MGKDRSWKSMKCCVIKPSSCSVVTKIDEFASTKFPSLQQRVQWSLVQVSSIAFDLFLFRAGQ